MREIPQEMLDKLLADYERPEDLVGPDRLLKERLVVWLRRLLVPS